MSLGPGRPFAVVVALVLTACSPRASASVTSSYAGTALTDGSSGVCQAIVALPDVAAAERSFANVAHEALHSLAAEPGLDRQLAAGILEAMQKVEADFGQSPPPAAAALTSDLTSLHESADRALVSLGQTAPPCAR
jgi:hypothetical protein